MTDRRMDVGPQRLFEPTTPQLARILIQGYNVQVGGQSTL
jgi:hypothetical protein